MTLSYCCDILACATPGLKWEIIDRKNGLFLYSAQNPLAQRHHLEPADFQQDPFYVLDADGGGVTRAADIQYCQSLGFTPILVPMPNDDSILHAISAGRGFGLFHPWCWYVSSQDFRWIETTQPIPLCIAWKEHNRRELTHVFSAATWRPSFKAAPPRPPHNAALPLPRNLPSKGVFCMLAYTYVSPGTFALQNKPKPVLLDDRDAIVKVTLSSICTSDLHIKHGHVPRAVPGVTVGHEMVGVVEQVGDAVRSVRPGDRVTVNVETFCGQLLFLPTGLGQQLHRPQRGLGPGLPHRRRPGGVCPGAPTPTRD